MTPRRKSDDEGAARVAGETTEPAKKGFLTDDGRFDANAAAEAGIEDLVGKKRVLPRRRAYATVLHTADVAVAGKPVEPSEQVRAALRIGEP